MRLSKRGAAWIAACAGSLAVLLVRLHFARHAAFCGVPDSCAYFSLARSLSQHRGFSENFIFDYQLDRLRIPMRGIEYWRAGTSLIFLLAQPFGGVTLASSVVITVLATFAVASAAGFMAWQLTRDQAVAAACYLLCLVLPPLWGASIIPDSGPFYAAAVAWFLALLMVDSRSWRRDVLALGCASAAYLIRNDALMLIVPLSAVLVQRYRERGENERRGWGIMYAAAMLAGFLVALAPAHWLNSAVLGSAFPSGPSRALFLNDLSELLRYGAPINARTWLSLGAKGLVRLRLATLAQVGYRLFLFQTGFAVIFIPFVWSARTRWSGGRETASAPHVRLGAFVGHEVFLATVLVVYTMVLPAIGGFSAFRSGMGLLPAAAVLMVLGMVAVARSRGRAMRLAAGAFALYFLSGSLEDSRSAATMAANARQERAVASFLETHGAPLSAHPVIMIGDAAQFSATTEFAAVEVPSNGWIAASRAAKDFGVSYVVLGESDDVAGAAAALHAREVTAVPGTGQVALRTP